MLISVSSITSNLPPIVPGVGGIVLTGMQSFLTASSFSLESNPLTRAKYSKFVDKKDNSKLKMIDSRDGMTLIYLPAFAASTIITILSHITEFSFLPQSTLAGQFVIIHFLKRLLEVFFLHKYSGKVSQSLSTQIGIYYAIVSVLILSVADPSSSINAVNTKIASALFGIGTVGNFYHHYILASLRSDETKGDKKKYVVPVGGLFNYVAAPHYLFELMAWLGIAVISNHTNAYLVFATMTSYLAGRAVSQNGWNRSKFSDKAWPSTRKNMIPFLF